MPIKINETNPIHPLLSAVTAVGEEAGAKVKDLFCPDTIASAQVDHENDCPIWIVAINYAVSVISFALNAVTDFGKNLLDYIGNALASLAGGKTNFNNIDQAALDAAYYYTANRAKISQAPVDRSISAQDLKDVYELRLDSILTVYDELPDDAQIPGMRKTLEGYIEYIQNGLQDVAATRDKIAIKRAQGDQEAPKAHPKAFEYAEMEKMMMHIAFHFGQKEDDGSHKIPPAKICESLTKLKDAWEGCGPHKYKGLKRGFEKVIGGTLEEKFLFWLKDFKRELILQRYQGEQMHVENHAAHQLVDWGIGPDKAEANDPYEMIGGCGLSGLNYRYTLNQECTPARIIQVFKTNLDMEDPMDTVTPFLQALSEKNPDALPEDLHDEIVDEHGKKTGRYHYWERDPELSKPGHEVRRPNYKMVALLAEKTGFLTPSLTIL